MPHLRIRGLSEKSVQQLSLELPPVLSKLLQTPEDHFTVERVSTQFFCQGKASEGAPMIEVFWFDRGQDMKDQCAQVLTEKLQSVSKSDSLVVIFFAIPKNSYFENGRHFGG